jgi:hypothetical protein
MNKNMGMTDRIFRVILAVAVVVLYMTNILSGTLAVVLTIFSGILILTSFIGTCPLYMPIRISTRSKRKL